MTQAAAPLSNENNNYVNPQGAQPPGDQIKYQLNKVNTNQGIRPVVALREVSKIYGRGENRVVALNQVSVNFAPGVFTAIMGPSGSGKSTMLNVLAGLDTVTSGSVQLEGIELGALGDNQLTKLRRERIGFVFQSFNLIPTLDAQANILLPSKLAKRKVDPGWAAQIVRALGIEERLKHKPSELSGGQQQRVALARALITRPAVVVADEPTGNLDSKAANEVLDLLRAAVDQLGQTVIMVTHDRHCAERSDRLLVVRDGHIEHDLWKPTAAQIESVA